MRRAISPATCTQVTSWPSGVCSHSALRSLSSEALSSAALTKAPGKYQRSFTVPSTGERFECTLNTFMNTLTLRASRSSQGSRALPTSTMRPSAGETTARGSSGTSRAGSRKNCRTNSAASQSGSAHQEKNQVAAAASTSAARTNGQPSRAMTGCGYGGFTYFESCSLRRSDPCCIDLFTSTVTLSTVFFGCAPMFLDCSGLHAASTRTRRLILGSVDKAVLPDPRHHLAQPRADLLDRQLGRHAALRQQSRRPGAVLQHELL